MFPDSPRRAELLSHIVDELLDHGVGDLSLRPLADRVGTSARLLIYHFGSKEDLLATALSQVRRDVERGLLDRAAQVQPQSLHAVIMMVWDWSTMEANQRYFRLLFEVDGLTLFNRVNFSRETQKANSATWTTLINRAAATFSSQMVASAPAATLLVCAIKGLLQEFLATGDRGGTTAALSTLLEKLSLVTRQSAHRSAGVGK
jgi:AcrR family transcriptional regulator